MATNWRHRIQSDGEEKITTFMINNYFITKARQFNTLKIFAFFVCLVCHFSGPAVLRASSCSYYLLAGSVISSFELAVCKICQCSVVFAVVVVVVVFIDHRYNQCLFPDSENTIIWSTLLLLLCQIHTQEHYDALHLIGGQILRMIFFLV